MSIEILTAILMLCQTPSADITDHVIQEKCRERTTRCMLTRKGVTERNMGSEVYACYLERNRYEGK